MPIDFTLTAKQRDLQISARKFAHRVLAEVGPAPRYLATPEARFAVTRPFYEKRFAEASCTG